MSKAVQYERPDGSVPFQDWLDSLHAVAALKVRTAVARMQLGNFGDHEPVGTGVWERKLDFEKGYRIYYGLDGTEIVLLLYGGTKSRQQSDIEFAKLLWSEYKIRKKQDLMKKQIEAEKAVPSKSKQGRKKGSTKQWR